MVAAGAAEEQLAALACADAKAVWPVVFSVSPPGVSLNVVDN